MKDFLRAAMDRADAERAERLTERARTEARAVPPKPMWHAVAKAQRARGMSIAAIARYHRVTRMSASDALSGKRS